MTRSWKGVRPALAGVVLGLNLLAAPAAAQPGESPPHVVGPGPARFPVSNEERRERLRMVRMWRLMDVLDLREGQSDKFFLALKRYDGEEDRLNELRERLSASLRGMVAQAETPEKALLDTIQALRQQDEVQRQARARFRSEVAGILSVRQQAKLLLFEQRFDAVIRDTIIEFMIHRRGGPRWRGRPGGEWGEGLGPPGQGEPPSGPTSR